MPESKPYWFRPKLYGWGWGLPATWQGWVVMVAWLAVVLSVSPWLALRSTPLYTAFLIAMVAALLAICYLKGGPPRWRWGRD